MATTREPSRRLLGIDIGGTEVKVALLTARGRILRFDSVPTRPDRPAGRMAKAVGKLVRSWNDGKPASLESAGVACAGLADPDRGVLHASPNLPDWVGEPIGRLLARELDLPVSFDNDVNAAAFGEYRRGAGRGSRAFLCVTVGTGVGGGLVLGGRLHRGVSNFAGEVGHITIDHQGPRCSCGNRGCVETYVGVDPIVRSARRALRDSGRKGPLHRLAGGRSGALTPKLVAEAARAGDRAARRVFLDTGEKLGIGLGSVLNLLNLDRIAVGGGISESWDLLAPGVEKGCRAFSFDAVFADVTIVKAALGNRASVIGAALLSRRDARRFDS
jgi:glucokinase